MVTQEEDPTFHNEQFVLPHSVDDAEHVHSLNQMGFSDIKKVGQVHRRRCKFVGSIEGVDFTLYTIFQMAVT